MFRYLTVCLHCFYDEDTGRVVGTFASSDFDVLFGAEDNAAANDERPPHDHELLLRMWSAAGKFPGK
jgi:hypothetical protein